MSPTQFNAQLSAQGSKLFRTMPWRLPEPNGLFSAYKILVSEVMLQQTQVSRVIPAYEAFIKKYPTIQSLAAASLTDVITAWSGLGYNRRAVYLHQAAQQLPHAATWEYSQLVACKGIGPNTAAAVLVYAYNQPHIFVETNVRTLFIYYFFSGQTNVSDAQIVQLVSSCLNQQAPRQWYWQVMDIGAHIKSTQGNLARSSSSYKKQSIFEGSRRQLRGVLLRQLQNGPQSLQQLMLHSADVRLSDVLHSLTKEHLVSYDQNLYYLGEKP